MRPRPLARSASAPGGASALNATLSKASSVHTKASHSCLTEGGAKWDPYRFVHHSDGAVSFQALGSADPLPCGGSWTPSTELFLDADKRQPFVAAPWAPLGESGPRGSPFVDGQRLYPFTLSYAPLKAQPPVPQKLWPPEAAAERRTVVLAATDARARNQWLESFAQKAHNEGLRPAVGRPSAQAARPGRPRRRFAALGEFHCGLPLAGRQQLQSALPRLPPGRPELWEASSSLRVVQDLYNGYAADPLQALLSSSGGSKLPPKGWAPVASPGLKAGDALQEQDLFLSYLEKQAKIESLLEQKLREEPVLSPVPAASGESETESKEAESHEQDQLQTLRSFELLGRTANTVVDGDLVSNEDWSGGALFAPPSAESFQISVTALEDPRTHPIFLGIAPRDSDLTM
ncbi:unnamed protein product, partial [Polarella glacialis]